MLHSLGYTSHRPFRPVLALASFLTLLAQGLALDQKIAFVSWRDSNYEIYVMDRDGGNQTRLTSHPARDDLPRWSPDGKKLLFESDRDPGFGEIYVMNADGSSQTNLTNDPRLDFDAWWSPDGTRILFHGARDIYVMNADGSGQTKLTDFDSRDQSAQWSPDGTKIAFESLRDGNWEIYVMNADGSGQTNLTNNSAGDTKPRWSPDGTRIAFMSSRAGQGQLYAMGADGSNPVNLALDNPFSLIKLEWSPDGKQILFPQGGPFTPSQLTIIDADGGSPPVVISGPANDAEPQWSPDGRQILFVSTGVQFSRDIWVMNADGSGRMNLSAHVQEDRSPQFQPPAAGQSPFITPGGIVLSTLLPQVHTVSPRSIISIFGANLSSDTILFPNLTTDGKLDTKVGGTCVEIAGERSPIFAVTPIQANIQVPAATFTGEAGVEVIRNCDTPDEMRSDVETVVVEESSPGFFIFAPVTSEGFIAARFNATSTQAAVPVAPVELYPDDSYGPGRPAKPGDIIVLYGTGWGETEPALDTAELSSGAAALLPAANPMVSFGGVFLSPEDVLYVGVTPETAGLYQLVVQVPETAMPGNNPVVLTVYGKSTPVGPVVPVAGP